MTASNARSRRLPGLRTLQRQGDRARRRDQRPSFLLCPLCKICAISGRSGSRCLADVNILSLEESLKRKPQRFARPPWSGSGRDGRSGSLRDLRDRFRYSFCFVPQCQVGLRDDANDTVFSIHNWNSPRLMPLHQSLACLDIFTIPATERKGC